MAEQLMDFAPGETLYSQGDRADTVLFVHEGRVQLSVLSPTGGEAVVGIVTGGEYLGEDALAGKPVRRNIAKAMTACRIRIVPKELMLRLLHQQHEASDRFIAQMLARNRRLEEDLVDQLFNACEGRLAHSLIQLARGSRQEGSRHMLPPIAHHVLANMVGTTRSRVTVFMNEFRKRGFVDYDAHHLAVDVARLTAMLEEPSATPASVRPSPTTPASPVPR